MRRLLVRPGAIGDCLCSLPALWHLQADETEVWINGAVAPLVGFGTRIRSLAGTGFSLLGVPDLPLPSHLLEDLRSFDEIISWSGHNLPAFSERARDLSLPIHFLPALPEPDAGIHVTDFFLHQTEQWHGIREEPAAWKAHGGRRFLLAVTSDLPAKPPDRQDFRQLVVLHPFSGSAAKNWPLSLYRQLAQSLQPGATVQWCSGPEDLLPDDLAPQAWRDDQLLSLAMKLTQAAVYVGNDSGITHLAAMLGVPVVALFGPMDPVVWAPRGAKLHIVQTSRIGLSTSSIPFESVLGAVQLALRSAPLRTPNPVR